MKKGFSLFVLALAFTAFGQTAHAGTLYGSIGLGGGAVLGPSGITFNNINDTVAGSGTPAGSGMFSSFTAGLPGVFTHNFTFSGISSPGGEQLFSVLNSTGTQILQFVVNSYSVQPGIGKFVFFGTLTLSNYDPLTHMATTTIDSSSASFDYVHDFPQNDFDGTLTVTPEPGSLVLLGTGLAGAAGLLVARRRKTASMETEA